MAAFGPLMSKLPKYSTFVRVVTARSNSQRAAISRANRSIYSETYTVTLVFPDGSSSKIRYREPRAIIQLPLDLSKLSEKERLELLMKRKSKVVKVLEDDIEDSFDPSQYSYLWK